VGQRVEIVSYDNIQFTTERAARMGLSHLVKNKRAIKELKQGMAPNWGATVVGLVARRESALAAVMGSNGTLASPTQDTRSVSEPRKLFASVVSICRDEAFLWGCMVIWGCQQGGLAEPEIRMQSGPPSRSPI
jgi:hypothetical protein